MISALFASQYAHNNVILTFKRRRPNVLWTLYRRRNNVVYVQAYLCF